MLEFALVIVALAASQAMQLVDDLLSQAGVVSVAHGMLLGYGQIFVSRAILAWGGSSLGWTAVVLVGVGAMGVSLYRMHNTGTRWVFAFNFGLFCGIIYGGVSLV
ncbi:hypothetical protein [Desulfomicrobium salsuginis]